MQFKFFKLLVVIRFPLVLSRTRSGSDLSHKRDPNMSSEEKSALASLSATAAWRLSRWKDLKTYTGL